MYLHKTLHTCYKNSVKVSKNEDFYRSIFFQAIEQLE